MPTDEPLHPRPPLSASALFGLTCALLLAFTWSHPPAQFPDTQSYLDHAVIRAPLYPLVLDLARLLAGTVWPYAITGLQAVVAALAGTWLTTVLQRQPGVQAWWALGVHALVLLPQLQWAGDLLTESLSHSLALAVVATLLSIRPTHPAQGVWRAALLVALGLSLRPSLLFLVPGLAVWGLALAWDRRSGPLLVHAVLAAVVAFALGTCAQIVGNGARNGVWNKAVATGQHAAAVQLYLSTPEERAALAHADDRAWAASVAQRMADLQLLQSSAPGVSDTHDGFSLAYDGIVYLGIVPEARARLGHAQLTPEDWVALDARTTHLAAALAQQHPRALLAHVAQEFRGQDALTLFLLVTLLVALARWRHTRQSLDLWLLVAAVWAVVNHAIVALVQVNRIRYTLTPDLLVLAAWALVVLVPSASPTRSDAARQP